MNILQYPSTSNSIFSDYKAPTFLEIFKAPYLLFLCYLIFSVFYVFESGYPQPAHFILLIAMLITFSGYCIKSRKIRFPGTLYLLLFCGYTFVVNMIHYAFSADTSYAISSLYYIYNGSVFLFLLGLIRRSEDTYKKVIYWGVVTSVLIQSILAFFYPVNAEEPFMGTFNSIEQISFWALASLALLILIKYKNPLNILDYLVIALLGYIQIMTGLGLGVVIYILFCAAILFTKMVRPLHKFFILFLFVILSILTIFNLNAIKEDSNYINFFSNYIEAHEFSASENSALHKTTPKYEYIILGAGEGRGNQDQPSMLDDGFTRILLSYGAFGAFLLICTLFAIFKRVPFIGLLMLGGLLLFGLGYQNFHSTYFWIFMATAYMIANERRNEKAYIRDFSYALKLPQQLPASSKQ